MELAEGSLTDLLDAFANDRGTAVQPELARANIFRKPRPHSTS